MLGSYSEPTKKHPQQRSPPGQSLKEPYKEKSTTTVIQRALNNYLSLYTYIRHITTLKTVFLFKSSSALLLKRITICSTRATLIIYLIHLIRDRSSRVFELAKGYELQMLTTSPLHLKSDGQINKFNQHDDLTLGIIRLSKQRGSQDYIQSRLRALVAAPSQSHR